MGEDGNSSLTRRGARRYTVASASAVTDSGSRNRLTEPIDSMDSSESSCHSSFTLLASVTGSRLLRSSTSARVTAASGPAPDGSTTSIASDNARLLRDVSLRPRRCFWPLHLSWQQDHQHYVSRAMTGSRWQARRT